MSRGYGIPSNLLYALGKEQEDPELEKEHPDPRFMCRHLVLVPKKVAQPWLFETRKLMSEPPDINYREVLDADFGCREDLDKPIYHFTERVLLARSLDICAEEDTLGFYDEWAEYMMRNAKHCGDQSRLEFFEELKRVVAEDKKEVRTDWEAAYKAVGECTWYRARLEISQDLGISSDPDDWTAEDKGRFAQYHKPMPFHWPRPARILERFEKARLAKAALALSASIEHQRSDSGDYGPLSEPKEAVEEHCMGFRNPLAITPNNPEPHPPQGLNEDGSIESSNHLIIKQRWNGNSRRRVLARLAVFAMLLYIHWMSLGDVLHQRASSIIWQREASIPGV